MNVRRVQIVDLHDSEHHGPEDLVRSDFPHSLQNPPERVVAELR